ncbi:MAG: nicotinamide riboside transporter PnuC [Paraclostridium sp.]|uniref:nicotinamide riboside transporter PnuC n=1 Tax=Paraclostridium sp. TaxID=2023273 RepID=UPI003F342A87
MNFFKSLSPFQKIFFIFFMAAGILSFFVPLFTGDSNFFELFSVISIIGLISSLSGVLTSIYQVRASIACYFWWILNTVTYGIVAIDQHLYGQFIQNIVFLLPLEIWGFIAWKKNLSNSENDSITVKKFTTMNWVITIIALLICWFLYGELLNYLPEIFKSLFNMKIQADNQIKLDSFTSIITIFAVFLTSKRYIEQWYFWIIANIGIVLFIKNIINTGIFSVSDLSGALVWAQYGTASVYGLYCWLKIHKKQTA